MSETSLQRLPKLKESQATQSGDGAPELSERQLLVLRAVVSAFLADGLPVSSKMVSHLISVKLSSASVRNTMAELASLGLIEKAHASSGRIPTENGLRAFVAQVLSSGSEIASYQQRQLAQFFESVHGEGIVQLASQLLSDHTRQLGFVVAPSLHRVVLRHISLVRLSSERVLVLLVTRSGQAHRRVIHDESGEDQPGLDRIAQELNRRLLGMTLAQVRSAMEEELRGLQHRAGSLVQRALRLGLRAIEANADAEPSLVIASRLALLDQPEFEEPGRVRELFEAVEANERLLELLNQLLDSNSDDVSVALGNDFEEASLRSCALVAARYGDSQAALGVLGVIGSTRMDYARIIPMVGFCSQLVTQKLSG